MKQPSALCAFSCLFQDDLLCCLLPPMRSVLRGVILSGVLSSDRSSIRLTVWGGAR